MWTGDGERRVREAEVYFGPLHSWGQEGPQCWGQQGERRRANPPLPAAPHMPNDSLLLRALDPRDVMPLVLLPSHLLSSLASFTGSFSLAHH